MSANDSVVAKQLEVFAQFNSDLGLFVLVYAKLEGNLYRVLLRYSGVSDAIGRSIFSGTRARTMIEHLRAILANTSDIPEYRSEHLTALLDRISVINTARDEIVHSGLPTYSTTGIVISTEARAKRYGSIEVKNFTVDSLKALLSDVQGVELHLGFHSYPGEFDSLLAQHPLPAAWQYKPPQPKNNRPKNASAGQGRRGPPSSSSGKNKESDRS